MKIKRHLAQIYLPYAGLVSFEMHGNFTTPLDPSRRMDKYTISVI